MRQPAVADRFYPGNPGELKQTVLDLLPKAAVEKKKAIGIVAPHAGYIYSGQMAGSTIGSTQIPETVIILGPNHHGKGANVAISTTPWQMPNGVVPSAIDTAEKLIASSPLFKKDELAHQFEHSLEVQIPFLQALQPDLNILPITVTRLSFTECEEVAGAISSTISESEGEILILASTDMSHYESRTAAAAKDKQALDKVLALDPEGLYRTVMNKQISMCGFIPVAITLQAALNLGATEAELIGYTDSGVVSGDTHRVVGYAGVIIS